MRIDGQCHCGKVTYEAEIDPVEVYICHCTDCQRLTGSPFRVTVITASNTVRLTGSAPKLYIKHGDNGNVRKQFFCPECGSPLFTTGEDETGERGIRWGSINQRSQLFPREQMWCRSAATWLPDISDLPEDQED